MMAYYDLLLTQWQLGKLTVAQVDLSVTKAYITTAQGTQIKNTPKSV